MDCIREINFCLNLFSRMQMNLNLVLNFSCDLTRLHSQGVIHHHTPPRWYRPCGRGDLKFSIWNVTSCDHVVRVLWLSSRLTSPYVSTLQSLVPKLFWRNIWLHTISHQLAKFHSHRSSQKRYNPNLSGSFKDSFWGWGDW